VVTVDDIVVVTGLGGDGIWRRAHYYIKTWHHWRFCASAHGLLWRPGRARAAAEEYLLLTLGVKA
jgi:hypothetical protein